jgi:oxygen-independent coproporphyrinogen-3 oxidase
MHPRNYTDAVKQTGAGIESQDVLSGLDAATEYLLMGLRIDEGISLSRFQSLGRKSLNMEEVNHLIESKLLCLKDDRLRATDNGRILLNAVTERLLLNA